MKYDLEKPLFSGKEAQHVIDEYFRDEGQFSDFIKSTYIPEYLYWDKVKYKKHPVALSAVESWYLVKFIRRTFFAKADSPIRREDGSYFTWLKLPSFDPFFHEVDLNTGGNLAAFRADVNDRNKQRFISRGIMEEAIASSQLEGANTTRKAAKALLREGRTPKGKAEQMIVNNYETIKAIEEHYRHQPLNRDMLLELHRMITYNTVTEEERGRFRSDEDEVVVGDIYGAVVHEPPKMKFVEDEIDRLIDFANDAVDESFIHPVVRAIMLHFWIGYLHPFTDGNGRLARLLFYWYLLRKDYWAFAYLPISTVIKRSPTAYYMAYIYSEQDDSDFTYFIDYNIRKIKEAVGEFEKYIEGKAAENRSMNRFARGKYSLNERQIQLAQFYRESPDERTSVAIHTNVNQISKQTAINDLKELEKLGFVRSERHGRNIYYYGTKKLDELF